MAVQILSYAVRGALLESQRQIPPPQKASVYPLTEDLERFYQHLEHVLSAINFICRVHPELVMNKLCRLFNHARPENQKLNILRGMLTSIEHSQKPHHTFANDVEKSLGLSEGRRSGGLIYFGCRWCPHGV